MHKHLTLFFFFALHVTFLSAQRAYNITRVDTLCDFDGHHQHPFWQNVPEMDEFVAFFPNPGQKPQQLTQVKMLSTPAGIYVLAHCKSAKVRDDGSARDVSYAADYVSVQFDTWLDRQNTFTFTVTAAGQMLDARSNNVVFNVWWRAKAHIVADGWTAEFFIPYTALRFPNKGEQEWGLQVVRYDRSSGETSTWNPKNPYVQDEAWQFGVLKGLGAVKQKTRLGMAVLANFNNEAVNDAGVADLGVDGRLGLGSATTLDFTLLPNTNIIGSSLEGGGFFNITNPGYPQPRQFAADEAGVYQKTGLYNPHLGLDFDWYASNLPLKTGEFIVSGEATSILQSTTLSSRMRKGVGLTVSNTLYDKPEEPFFASTSPFSSFAREIPLGATNHTNVAIEKLFRNNSWVNVSHNLFIVGNDFTKHQSGFSLQLRDKSNQYQVAATGRTTFSKYDQLTRIAVGKVNGAWTWAVQYEKANSLNVGRFTFGSELYQESFGLSVNKTDFQPKYKHWLRTTHSASLKQRNGFSSSFSTFRLPIVFNFDDRWFANYSFSALTRKFNSWQANVSFVPEYAPREVNVLGGRFYGNKYMPLLFGLNYRSDERKRWVINASATASLRLNDTQKHYVAQLGVSFAPVQAMRLTLDNTFSYSPNFLRTSPEISEPNVVTKVNTVGFIQRYGFELFATKKVTFSANQYLDLSRAFLSAFRFNDQIDLEPYEFQFPLNPTLRNSFQTQVAASWFFTPNSQFSISYSRSLMRQSNFSSSGIFFIPGFSPDELIGEPDDHFRAAFIWNLNNR